jgi:L-fuculose-phosphate aldolase
MEEVGEGMLAHEFERIGKRLFTEGLVGANFGNMSVRGEDGFYITRTGCYLDVPCNPVFVPMEGLAPGEASSEYRVHREVYRRTRHCAIVHAHPPYACAASLLFDEILPEDSEGELLCPVIPVVRGKPGSDELAHVVAEALILGKLAIARGHGTFSAGKDLDEAYVLTSLGAHACQVLWLLGQFE